MSEQQAYERDDPRSVAAFEWALIALLSLGAAWAGSSLFPRHEGASMVVQLTELHPADALDPPEPRVLALPAFRRAPTGEATSRSVSGHELSLPVGGRFSVYGWTSHDASEPIELRIDGRPISHTAFWRATGSRRSDFERHRIATGVRLEEGLHRILLRGDQLERRTLLLELRREGAAPLRAAAIAAAVAGLLALRRRAWRRLAPSRGTAAALSLALALGGPAALWAAAAARDGEALAAAGDPSPLRSRTLRAFERETRDPALRRRCAARFCVALLGDSTQFWGLKPRERMRARLREQLPDDFELVGVSAAGLNAYDYYYLTQRVVDLGVDVVVVPVSLRSFSTWWLEHPGMREASIEQSLRLDEWPRALALSVADRTLVPSHWLLLRLDRLLFDGGAGPVLAGLRALAQLERERAALRAERWLPLERPPATPPARGGEWPPPLTPAHELFDAFRALEALTRRHGMRLLYYTVPVNEAAQERLGTRVDAAAQYGVAAAVLTGAPHVDLLDLASDPPDWLFGDVLDHMSPDGMRHVSDRVVEALLAIRSAHDAPASE